MVSRLHEELIKDNYLHADETPIQVMNEDGKKNTTKSYMWVYTTSSHSDKQIRIFEYCAGRVGTNAADFLDGYTGFLKVMEKQRGSLDGFVGVMLEDTLQMLYLKTLKVQMQHCQNKVWLTAINFLKLKRN